MKVQIPTLIAVVILLGFQSYNNTSKNTPSIINEVTVVRQDTILLVLMNFNETNLTEEIKNKVTSFYHIPVKFTTIALPGYAYLKERNRYSADSILRYLEKLNIQQYKFIVGLTSKDISTRMGTNPSWGIFGLGTLSAKGCVISSFRLKRNASPSLLITRMQKIVLHEIGHNHGLNHCVSPFPCFMKAANGKISEVDTEPMDMCKECRKTAKLTN